MNTARFTGDDMVTSGHTACAGCGEVQIVRMALMTLGPKTVISIVPSCMTGCMGRHPVTALKVPVLHMPFETAGASGTGISAALHRRGIEATVMTIAGDGGTFDIGFQALSAAAERNENFIYLCCDNEAYMNTGIQRSSATPAMSWTTTTTADYPKKEPKKDIMAIMAAHRIPYAATVCAAYPEDLMAKFQRARNIKGFRFFHALSPCPTGWRHDPGLTIHMGRMAVETGIFPLYEVEGGRRYRLTYTPKHLPVKEYLDGQGRFTHLTPDMKIQIQRNVEEEWAFLMKRFAESES
ncbi:MAG: pyruvate synthase subunit beta [Deltaproteobacteria bacterium]|nr:pyruvate synthase subunit beta [Deltaproteobacteria bacterium]